MLYKLTNIDHQVKKSVSVYTDHSLIKILVNTKVKSKACDLPISARGTDSFESGYIWDAYLKHTSKWNFPITGGDCEQGCISFGPVVLFFIRQCILETAQFWTAILQEAKFSILGVAKVWF